jgi:hemerythrin-like domain-containing protein
MQPIGLLMKEHRLIERMIPLLEKELKSTQQTLEIDTDFIEVVVDFFITYADKTHHKKEEDILFKSLKKKNISAKHKKILDKLLKDHKASREIVRSLHHANIRYKQGYHANIKLIHNCISKLITLYPKHINLEDKQFFFPAMDYFTTDECNIMLEEFYNFDKIVIHEHYSDLIDTLEKNSNKNFR